MSDAMFHVDCAGVVPWSATADDTLDAADFQVDFRPTYAGLAIDATRVALPRSVTVNGGETAHLGLPDGWSPGWGWQVRVRGASLPQQTWTDFELPEAGETVALSQLVTQVVPSPSFTAERAYTRSEVDALLAALPGTGGGDSLIPVTADVSSIPAGTQPGQMVGYWNFSGAPRVVGDWALAVDGWGVWGWRGGEWVPLSGEGVSVARKNLVPNPSFDTNLTYWLGQGGTLSRETAAPMSGSGSAKLTVTASGANTSVYSSAEDRLPVTPGQVITVSYDMRQSSAVNPATTIICHNAAGAQIYAPNSSLSHGILAPGTVRRQVFSMVAPAGVASFRVLLGYVARQAGDVLEVDNVTVETASAATDGSYFKTTRP